MAAAHVAPCAPATVYMPSTPSQVPQPVIDYARLMIEAPMVALGGETADKKEVEPISKQRRHRTRHQVGATNRWRLPHSLISDLLGLTQANKSMPSDFLPFNKSFVRICTADSRYRHINDDSNQDIPTGSSSRKQNLLSARLNVTPLCINQPSRSVSTPRMAKSAPANARRLKDNIAPLNTFVPSRARPSNPRDVFFYHSKQNPNNMGAPDVLLHCLAMDWELHSTVLRKSTVLTRLMNETKYEATEEVYYKTSVNETLDSMVHTTGIYDNSVEASKGMQPERDKIKGHSHLAHISKVKHGNVVTLVLTINDPAVKKDAFAVALGNLYHQERQVEQFELSDVLIAAAALGFDSLENLCVDKMKLCISYSTVCSFYTAAIKSKQRSLADACIHWLELNLTVKMMNRIQLRDIPVSLLETVLKSSRLFTYSEYHLYACCATWLFLRLNSEVQLLPTPVSVMAFFNSMPKQHSFLEGDGEAYRPIFDCLRLHGITDTAQFQNIRQMNILTQDSMVSLLSEHYNALQSGGDMGLMRNFFHSSVRQGYVIGKELPYHSEIFSLHGFHFELKTVKVEGAFTFFMQRLKPTDPVLSFKQCERQTFSMRPDRSVKYCITVQNFKNGKQQLFTTGIISQRFSLNGKHTRSKVLTLKNMDPPFYVTHAFLFPQS